jgi:putative hydrolase of the HAD superfamily
MIKNIIFDLGNVLLEFKPLDYLKGILKNDVIVDDIYKSIFLSEEWVMLDSGTITQEEAVKQICSRSPKNEMYIKQCMDKWFDILTPIEKNVKILNKLKQKGYKLYILSNFHALAFEIVSNKYDFFKCFDGGIISYKENLLKPQPEIFNRLIEEYNIKAEESLFIDDTLANIEAANSLDFKTIHFNSPNSLEEGLKKIVL